MRRTKAAKCRPPKAPLPFTVSAACEALRHGVLVDPFPSEPKYSVNLTTLIRQYPDLATWRRVADWLAEGGDGYGSGFRGGKPDLGALIARFGGWVQQAAAATPERPRSLVVPTGEPPAALMEAIEGIRGHLREVLSGS